MPRLEGKIALITGASRGIGAAVAKAYAREGAQVILIARTTGGLEEVDDAIRTEGGKPATLVPLDLLEFDKIDGLGGMIAEKYGRLDILVGNAAILGELAPISSIDPKVWQKVIDLNLTANYRLLRSFDPLLRQSQAGRVQFVTSGVVAMQAPFWGAYAVSKAGLEKLADTYAAEVKNTNIQVETVDPGVVRTRMRASAFPGEDPMTLPTPEEITDRFLKPL